MKAAAVIRGPAVKLAKHLQIGGVVQGVGFRPFVYRIALELGVRGWVLNAGRGVEIHAEGDAGMLDAFVARVREEPPRAARISVFDVREAQAEAFDTFEIRESLRYETPTVRISCDLPICDACLRELFDPADRRYRYPYTNCTDCGPRYSIVRGLPYDRAMTTMRDWPMCAQCAAEYRAPLDRRFHAQPLCCPACGPEYVLEGATAARLRGYEAIAAASRLLRDGAIVAVKGLGGYHVACDARNAGAINALRERKFRKERPFAVMVRGLEQAEELVLLDPISREALLSIARPIVLAPARVDLPGVAPENHELGVMLAYAPIHHLLFDAGAPETLVMTSGNRSSEPIAFTDADARERLGGIADALLLGEREIARRVDDSIERCDRTGPIVLRHSRGLAPQAVAELPARTPIVAVGADLKNAVAVVVNGQAFVSQHLGDLEHLDARRAFEATIADLCALYEIDVREARIAHDRHPEYASTAHALTLGEDRCAVGHHRAHVASVLAEQSAFETPVLGFAFDGTGYGDDGTIWGGEIFLGSLTGGLERVAHLRAALLPGGDAAARFPVQAAAGFVGASTELAALCDFEAAPFHFPAKYRHAGELLARNVRVFGTTSMGRLFDTAAALLGFTRGITFEGQAAMWLEHRAVQSALVSAYPFPLAAGELDYRPLLRAMIADRLRGRDVNECARAFHGGIVAGMLAACAAFGQERIVVSGGVFQNALLMADLQDALGARLWTNRAVPPNDGGICLGQAAIACC